MLYDKTVSPKMLDSRANVWKKHKAPRVVIFFGMHYQLHNYDVHIAFFTLFETLLQQVSIVIWTTFSRG